MHSSNCFGLVPLVLLRLFKNRNSPSILYALAVAYAVTLGRCARSAFPNRSASRRAVVSLIRVTCEYTSRPLSSSWFAGLGRILSFWETLLVRWGPILAGGGLAKGVGEGPWTEAERRRLLSAEGGSCCEGVTREIGAIRGEDEEEDGEEGDVGVETGGCGFSTVAIGGVWVWWGLEFVGSLLMDLGERGRVE